MGDTPNPQSLDGVNGGITPRFLFLRKDYPREKNKKNPKKIPEKNYLCWK